jgi:hypothetical protein
MNRNIFIAFFVLQLSACASNQYVEIKSVKFDKAQADKMMMPGKNKISGSALIRQQGGGVVTCAGLDVYMMPATDYAKKWAGVIYGSEKGGYKPTNLQGIEFINLDKDFSQSIVAEKCTPSGNFVFNKVADGEFYVFTKINWSAGGYIQGGSISKAVIVSGGAEATVVLSP